jgi:hypothetical protein
LARIAYAAHVESGIVEGAIGPVQRQEAQVAALARLNVEGRPFAREPREAAEMGASIGVGGSREQRGAVLRDDLHGHPRHRLAGLNGLHEHIEGSIGGFLRQKPEVRDEHQALVQQRAGVRRCAGLGGVPVLGRRVAAPFGLGGRVVAADGEQKQPALVLAVGLEIRAQIDGLVVRPSSRQRAERDFPLEALHQVVRPEVAVEHRVREVALRLGDEMLELIGQEPPDVDAHAGQVPHQRDDLAFAGQGQQGTLRQDLELRRVGRYAHHEAFGGRRQIAAEGAQIPLDLDVQVAADVGRIAEAVVFGVLAFAGDGLERQGFGLRKHLAGHLRHAVPVVGFVLPARRR